MRTSRTARAAIAILAMTVLLTLRPIGHAALLPPQDLRSTYESAEAAFHKADWAESERLFDEALGQAHWQQGRLRSATGRFKEAVEDFTWAQKFLPASAKLQADLGVADLGNGDYVSAVQALEKAAGGGDENSETLTTLGQAYFSLGNTPKARNSLQRALKLNPQAHVTAFSLGLVLLAEKKPAEATRVFEQLRSSVGDSARFRLIVARAYFDSGYDQQAEAELRRALVLDSRIHYAHHLLGLVALRLDETGRRDEAQREFEAEIRNHPDEFSPLFMLGVVLESKREWADGRSYLERARAVEPNNPDVYFHLGHILLEMHEPAEAARDLERSIGLTSDPAHAEYQVRRAHSMLSVAYRDVDDLEKSAAESRQAQQLSAEYAHWERENMSRLISLSKSVEKVSSGQPRVEWKELPASTLADPSASEFESMYSQIIANAHQRLGLIAAQTGRFEEAVGQFERVAALEPNFPRIDYNLGLAAFRAERMAEAVAALVRAVERDPSDLPARELLGRAQFEEGNCEAALPNLDRARSARESDPGLLLGLGTCLARAGRTAEAREVFRQLAEKHSSLPELHLFLGQAAYSEGAGREADAELHQALQLHPRIPQAHLFLGLISLDRGNWAAAEKEFRTETEMHPDDSKARYHLAYVLLLEQKREEGIKELETVLRRVPGYAEAHYSFGKALLEQGTVPRAIEELETAERLGPLKSFIHYQLGRAYMQAGRQADAQREFALAQKLKQEEKSPRDKESPLVR
jgi:tetratricopeptide (TPR) repeat protein